MELQAVGQTPFVPVQPPFLINITSPKVERHSKSTDGTAPPSRDSPTASKTSQSHHTNPSNFYIREGCSFSIGLVLVLNMVTAIGLAGINRPYTDVGILSGMGGVIIICSTCFLIFKNCKDQNPGNAIEVNNTELLDKYNKLQTLFAESQKTVKEGLQRTSKDQIAIENIKPALLVSIEEEPAVIKLPSVSGSGEFVKLNNIKDDLITALFTEIQSLKVFISTYSIQNIEIIQPRRSVVGDQLERDKVEAESLTSDLQNLLRIMTTAYIDLRDELKQKKSKMSISSTSKALPRKTSQVNETPPFAAKKGKNSLSHNKPVENPLPPRGNLRALVERSRSEEAVRSTRPVRGSRNESDEREDSILSVSSTSRLSTGGVTPPLTPLANNSPSSKTGRIGHVLTYADPDSAGT